MRVAGVCALSCALGICAAIGAQDAVSPEVLVIQEALKEQLSELRDAYPPLAAALAKQNDARAPAKLQQRLGEFEAFAKSITALEMQPEFVVIEQSSQTRMFSPSNRLSLFGGATTTIPAPAADEFFTGPNDEVAAHSGELRRVWIDASFPTRGGVGFELRRSYWSHEMYDGPLGKGWGHSYNQWIVGDVGESGELAGVEWHNEFRVVRFGRVGEHWIANDGSALKLEVDGNAIRIFTPELIRWNFESVSPLASEVPKSGKRLWRLVEVASRHGEWKANRLTLEYSKVGGQLIKVTDPFEMVFHFAYNDDGRLSQVTGPSTRVQYEFNEDGALIRTIVGKSAASGHSAYELSEEFGYTKIQGHALLQSTHRTGSTRLEVKAHRRRAALSPPACLAGPTKWSGVGSGHPDKSKYRDQPRTQSRNCHSLAGRGRTILCRSRELFEAEGQNSLTSTALRIDSSKRRRPTVAFHDGSMTRVQSIRVCAGIWYGRCSSHA